ncbi:unnamed protein product [Closterium sp. Naga37s-1]|nr:unnamed protein product [Closterium sp. Naga37s-1]
MLRLSPCALFPPTLPLIHPCALWPSPCPPSFSPVPLSPHAPPLSPLCPFLPKPPSVPIVPLSTLCSPSRHSPCHAPRAQMSEEVIWELFVQAGPVGEPRGCRGSGGRAGGCWEECGGVINLLERGWEVWWFYSTSCATHALCHSYSPFLSCLFLLLTFLHVSPNPSSSTCFPLPSPSPLPRSSFLTPRPDASCMHAPQFSPSPNPPFPPTPLLPPVNVYVPKDRVTGQHQGYGFVEFRSEEDADYVRDGGQDRRTVDVGANLFIGNLDPDVDEKVLYDTFSAFGVIVTNPKIMRDTESGNSKGFGFISYDSFEASDAAIEAMNGQYLCNRAISVSYAFKKDTKGERHGTPAGHFSPCAS